MRLLVTGATGQVGSQVIRHLCRSGADVEILAGVRNVQQVQERHLAGCPVTWRPFDFADPRRCAPALEGVDVLFLLRPPHISRVDRVFRPFLEAGRRVGLRKVVFLSVQGAEKSPVIPHNRIEGLIRELGFHHIFVRPSYFMQNLTTALQAEIAREGTIRLPAGDSRINWVDVQDVGEASALLMLRFEEFRDRAWDITGPENLGFQEVARRITQGTGREVRYQPVDPLRFFLGKTREGAGKALVMTMLHVLPRFQEPPRVTDDFRRLTGRDPASLDAFIARESERLLDPS